MKRICALALWLLLSLCSARRYSKIPTLTPLNCNETNAQVDLATDLINDDREEGFIIKPVRIRSIFEQKIFGMVPGGSGSLYYIDFEVQETKCSVLSDKKWKDCSEEPQFYEKVTGECKSILYIARPWKIQKIIQYNCTLGTVPSSSIVIRCPDCPVIVSDITPAIEAKAENLVENFNQQDNNQTHYFKLDNIERVRTQWVFGPSYFMQFTIKETDCLKTQENVVLENCSFIEDQKAHVGFCTGSVYNTPEKTEVYNVTCEIYNPKHDDDHHHRRGACEQVKEDGQEEEEAGSGEAGEGTNLPEKCELGKGKHCGRYRGHKHHCHPGHRHPHQPGHHHPGHRHHHHPGHRHHHNPGHRHHHHPGHHHPGHRHSGHRYPGHHPHHPDNKHDHRNHSHPHYPAHHHHNHTSAEHGSSSEETTDKQHFRRIKGSVTVYYLDGETPSPPVPTILRLPTPGKHMLDIADFPNEPSPLKTCPSPP